MMADIFLCRRLFESSEDLVSEFDCVGQAFQSRCELLEFSASEITVPYPCGQDQVIIFNRDFVPIWRVHEDGPLILIHACDLAHDDDGILLPSQNSPDRGTNLSRCKHRSRDLIKQGLKQVMIRAVN